MDRYNDRNDLYDDNRDDYYRRQPIMYPAPECPYRRSCPYAPYCPYGQQQYGNPYRPYRARRPEYGPYCPYR